MDGPASQLLAAISALYGPDLTQQQAANTWLNTFSKTPEAWAAALAVLDPANGSPTEAAFFCANLLLSKTRDEWGRLSPEHRVELADTYISRLRSVLPLPPSAAPALPPAVLLDRMALLAAATAALAGPGAAGRLMGLAVEAVRAGAASPRTAGGSGVLRCGLLLLQVLAEEADGADRGRRQALVGRAPSPVLAALLQGAQGQQGQGQGEASGLAAQRGAVIGMAREVLAAAANPPSPELLLGAVRCLGAWAGLDDSGAGGATGVSAGELEALSPGLLPSLLGLLGLGLGAPPAAPTATAPLAPLHEAVADVAADLLGPGGRALRSAAAAALGVGADGWDDGDGGGGGGQGVNKAIEAAAAADVATSVAAVEALVAVGQRLVAAGSGGGGGGQGGGGLSAVLALVRVAAAVAERNEGGLATGGRGAAEAEAAVPGCGEACVALARTVVALMEGRPERCVSEAGVDYLLALNTVPSADRHPALCAPLYGALLPLALRAVAYPSGFAAGGWEEAEEDEEAFYRFREQGASDLLESMWGQCRAPLLQQLVAAAETGAAEAAAAGGSGEGPGGGGLAPGGWRGCEAALLCVRAIHMPIKAAALGGRAGALDSPAAQEQAAALGALLGRLFGGLCDPAGPMAGLLALPVFAGTACRLLAEYAAWFGRPGQGPQLQAALTLVLHVLRRHAAAPAAAPAAAQALRSLAVRGADLLTAGPATPAGPVEGGPPAPCLARDHPTLAALLGAAMDAVAPPPPPGVTAPPPAVDLPQPERVTVVEGLARLAAALPPAAAAEAGCGLMAPLAARARAVAEAAAASGSLSPSALSSLASELSLMGAAVRFLELPGGGHAGGGLPGGGLGRAGPGGLQAAVVAAAAQAAAEEAAAEHPALRALQVAWPVLSAVAGEARCVEEPQVVEALAEVYKRSLLCTRLSGRVLLPALLRSLLGLLGSPRPHPAPMEVLGTVAEMFGELQGQGEARGLQLAALDGAARVMAAVMAAQQPGGAPLPPGCSAPDLAASFLALADRTLLFARDTALGWGHLPPALDWACGVLRCMREREPCAAALSLLQHLLGAADRMAAEAQQQEREREAAGQQGQGPGQQKTGADKDAELRARLDSLLSSAGPSLTHALLVGGTDTCPRALMRPLAGALAALLQGTGGAAGGGPASRVLREGAPGWLRGAWAVEPLAGLLSSGRLAPSHVERFVAVLLRGHPGAGQGQGQGAAAGLPSRPLPRGRLDALAADFFAMARGEAAEDVLLAYEIY